MKVHETDQIQCPPHCTQTKLKGEKKDPETIPAAWKKQKQAKLTGRVLDQLSPLERTLSNLLPAEIPDGWAACS